tara:strand:+ start:92 stop:454 length:363 start_codon:yes stop_codon:yes gene_type:complete
MVKKRFGPKLKMEGLPKASKARVKLLSLPVAIETTFETGYGPNNNLKWEMEIELLDHPTQEVLGKMVWQTTASVIRLEIMALVDNSRNNHKDIKALLADLQSCEWYITCDANGQIAIEEV